MLRFLRCRNAALCLVIGSAVAAHSVASAQDQQVQDRKVQDQTPSLVTVGRGDLPIILSAPHGGRDEIPGVPARKGDGVQRFVPRSDSNTDRLTERLADAIEKRMGKRPYVVIARFHRRYVDANRRKELAVESPAAESTYRDYHDAVRSAREDVIRRWGSGILLDLHGQSSEPDAIIRGTQNGETTEFLIRRFGEEALIGKSSLFGRLAEQEFSIIPTVGSKDDEHSRYRGGFIVQSYGSRRGGTVDAIQLELGIRLRSADALPETAEKLAKAIEAFADDYLPDDLLPTSDNAPSSSPDRRIRVGVYFDVGTGKSRNDVIDALDRYDDVSIVRLNAEDIRTGKLADIDVLIQPGGSGSKQGNHLGEDGRHAIRGYVGDGGGFIGICGGAYLATAHYKWSLNILDAMVVDTQHWARGHGMVKIGITDAGKSLLETSNPQLTIQYWQGPLLAPADRPEIKDYETIATFDTEIAENGAPKGVMPGTTAIAKGEFGKGRVICFSPHPELTDGLQHLLKLAIDDVKKSPR